jgi:hypothetical protein
MEAASGRSLKCLCTSSLTAAHVGRELHDEQQAPVFHVRLKSKLDQVTGSHVLRNLAIGGGLQGASVRGTLLGEAARLNLMTIVTGELTCRLTGEKNRRREIGYCSTADWVDIAQALIAGFALACPRFDPRSLPFKQPMMLRLQSRAPYCLTRSR